MNSTTSPMTTKPDQAQATRLLMRHAADEIAKALFHVDVLQHRSERAATWEGTTEADREAYRADARAALRRRDVLAMPTAMHKARKAARETFTEQARQLLAEGEGAKALDAAIDAAIAAHYAHLAYGKPDQDERHFERVHDIPSPREFTVIDGGRRVESAQQSEGGMSPLARTVFDIGTAMAAAHLPQDAARWGRCHACNTPFENDTDPCPKCDPSFENAEGGL